jgi:hypothetical protein
MKYTRHPKQHFHIDRHVGRLRPGEPLNRLADDYELMPKWVIYWPNFVTRRRVLWTLPDGDITLLAYNKQLICFIRLCGVQNGYNTRLQHG